MKEKTTVHLCHSNPKNIGLSEEPVFSVEPFQRGKLAKNSNCIMGIDNINNVQKQLWNDNPTLSIQVAVLLIVMAAAIKFK